ncbi:hypothetical protein Vadar_026726 [Vaccinium darrowii]|uniref:Uncharacterized protein n=1 Tax=Vaccinium darrowii TaxID=229202 RepID=A0ACB7X4D6_9ERIC|nr:hypothetical protein Vadar_026726 [Vaccinium darrowii]
MEHSKLTGDFDESSLEFQRKILERYGLGEETYVPAAMHCIPPQPSMAAAREEAETIMFGALDKPVQFHQLKVVAEFLRTLTCEMYEGVPWTEEEHRMFLLGLQKLGKGDWRGISRNYYGKPHLFCTSTNSSPAHFCTSLKTLAGEKFLWYAPHSGFSNQLSKFRNAILMAAILNQTLIVPPVLDHHAVALGSCPKFRVLSPNQLRFSVWNHIIDLVRTRRQVIFTYLIYL